MLTEKQDAILTFIHDHQREHGVTPSTREVARHFAIAQATALKHLQSLAKKDEVEKLADGKWGFLGTFVQLHMIEVPVFGAIPAGLPAQREQEPEETVRVSPAVFGVRDTRPGHFWFLRVTGDSMTGAGILDGDLVALVRREPRPGDIIAALVDGTETTLKRYLKERGRAILRAANPRYRDLRPRQLESQGVVVGLLRRKPA
jgi:repressor LexA